MAQLTIQQAFEVATQHHQAGRWREAEQLYRQILAQQPQHVESIYRLGVLALQLGRADAAVELIRQSIALNPSNAEAYYNLGIALTELKRLDDAMAAYRQAITLLPNYADAYNNLGIILRGKGDAVAAIAAYRQAIEFAPANAQAYNNLGSLLREMGQLDESITAHRRAIAINPNMPEAQSNLGAVLRAGGKFDDAMAAYRRAISLKPDFAEAHNNLGNALKDTGRLNEAIDCFRRAIVIKPDYVDAHSNLIFALHHHADYDSKALAEEERRFDIQHGEPLARFVEPHTNDRNPDRRLRIGYVSPDFRESVLGRNFLPLLKQHDRRNVEIFCYAHVLTPDAITGEFQTIANGWRNIVGLSDEQAAKQIRDDGIDILVNLNLHTANNRLLVFARKPAPVQVSYLGLCGSTGLRAIDFRLTDPYLDPMETDLSCYSETTVRLPHTFWCYEPRPAPDVSPPPAMKNGFVTFGSLNNFPKMSDAAMGLWARILLGVQSSRMMIHAPPGNHLRDVAQRFARVGVAMDRLIFVGDQPWADYMHTYSLIDIALDPFPYGGGITTCDAIWMGAPVVTLSGQTASGRAARSILTNVGLSEFIAFTNDQYIQIAVDLAKDIGKLAELRREMRSRMIASPLMDIAGFARDLEAAYRQMWRGWCETKSDTTAK